MKQDQNHKDIKLILLKLNVKTDADILNQLQQTEDDQEYIKMLIRKDLERPEIGFQP